MAIALFSESQQVWAAGRAAVPDLGGGVDEDEVIVTEDDLPAGIFPEAHPESCHHALKRYGLACTRLNAELFYEMDQLTRNRFLGCSTEELKEIDLWDPLSGASLWDEPVSQLKGRLLTPDEQLDNLNRQARWRHVERFLKDVYDWCREGRGPGMVLSRNRRGQSIWRFQRLRWTDEGIAAADPLVLEEPASPLKILQAAWNFLFSSRRRWLRANPGKVWLSEHCLHLIRHACRSLLTHFEVPPVAWPEIKEEPKPAWPTILEAKLSALADRERRGLNRLTYLERRGLLTTETLRRALDFFDGLAEELDTVQRRLDQQILKLAREHGCCDNWVDPAYLSPESLLELKEELRLVLAPEAEPKDGTSSGASPGESASILSAAA